MTINKRRSSDLLAISIVIILLIRLVLLGLMGPMPQDAYYFMYSENLALSYFDHPPVIAYILKVFVSLFGKNVFAIKLADTVVTLLTLYFFYRLARNMMGPARAGRAILLLFSTIMISIISLVTTPDTPLLLFWTLALHSLFRALFLEKNIAWLWAGLWMGIAFDSKYTAIFLPVGLIFFLVFSNRHRKKLLSPWLGLCVIIFLAVISPVFIWNLQHDFASFRFQSSERAGGIGLHVSPKFFLGTIGHQSGILLPVLFFSFFLFLYKFIRKYKWRIRKIPDQKLFLLCFFLPVFGGFLLVSLFYWVKLNWMMPAYISGIIWVGAYFNIKWIRIQYIISLILHLVFAYVIIFYPVPVKSDDTWYGWKELASKVDQIQQQDPGSFIFSANENKVTAELDFYLKQDVYAGNVLGLPALQYDYIGTNLETLKGRNAIMIQSRPHFKEEGRENDQPVLLLKYFDSVTQLEPILIKKGSKTVRKFLVYRCVNYHPSAN